MIRATWIGLVGGISISVASVVTATTAVEPTGAGERSIARQVNDFKPGECSSLDLADIVSGGGLVTGAGSSELVVAGSLDDTIDAGGGDDCVLGGGGDDAISGSAGSDICIGGPGTDSFTPDCETTLQ